MTIQKISSLASIALLASGLSTGALAQAQQQTQHEHQAQSVSHGSRGGPGTLPPGQYRPPPAQAQPRYQPQAAPRGYDVASGPPQGQYHPPPATHPGYSRPGYYRPPIAVAPPLPSRYYGYGYGYGQPGVAIMPSIMAGSVLPYGYGDYPIDDWGYYNLPAPCCGQYWVPYGPGFLLVNPDGVVLQVFTP